MREHIFTREVVVYGMHQCVVCMCLVTPDKLKQTKKYTCIDMSETDHKRIQELLDLSYEDGECNEAIEESTKRRGVMFITHSDKNTKS